MKLKLILITLLVTQSLLLFSQPKTITGRVIDEDGNPVVNASIFESYRKGNGTVSDKDGFYKLTNVSSYILKCTHINFFDTLISLSNNTKIVFIMRRHIYQHGDATVSKSLYFRKINTPPVSTIPDTSLKKERIEDDGEKIFIRVEVPARLMYNGYNFTSDDILKYFIDHINIDTVTIINNFEGMVVARFTIDKNGKTINPLIIRGLNDFTDSVIIDVINKMPLWEPAIQNGRSVDSEQEVAIHFYIEGKYGVN
ncbi:MAG: energy transducer TonB [Ferruginibacter sp.]